MDGHDVGFQIVFSDGIHLITAEWTLDGNIGTRVFQGKLGCTREQDSEEVRALRFC